jgi:hypothetical protein
VFAVGFDVALRNTEGEATSAFPQAPVVPHAVAAEARPVRSTRQWAAQRLRTAARGTYHLADRVDPVCLPRHA